MKTIKRRSGGPLTTLACGALLMALYLLQPAAARAQWTTPDGNGNINNTNTGNVGVGTNTPNYKFDITNLLDRSQVRFGMGGGDSGGFLYSGGPSHAAFSAGASFNGGWIAKSLSGSIIEHNLGQLTFYTNNGISTGNPFTPSARMVITSGGNVGIGTTTPAERLTAVLDDGVNNGISQIFSIGHMTSAAPAAGMGAGFSFRAKRSDGVLAQIGYIGGVWEDPTNGAEDGALVFAPVLNSSGFGTERMRINSVGNVGIGTATPDTFARLHLFGNGGFGQDIQTTTNDWTRLRFIAPSRTWGFFLDGQTSGLLPQGSFGLYDYTANAFRMVWGTTGNVGIGVPSPGHKLDVSGAVNASTGLCINGDCKSSWSQVGGSQWTGSSALNFSGNVGVGLTAAPARRLEVLGGNIFHQWSTGAGSEYGFFTAINNNHFTSNLYFDGQWKMIATGKGSLVNVAPASGFAVSVVADNTTRAANALFSGTQLFSVTMAGHVGVNTANPVFDTNTTKFMTVEGGSGAFGSLGVAGGVSTNATVGQVAFVNSNLGSADKRVATIVGSTDTASNSGNLDFYTASAGVFTTPRMRITPTGNVGIGTTTPSKPLDVVGDINASGTITGGNIKAKYQDVAEWVDSSQELSAGTVVVLDSTKSNQVVAATQSYDSRVAGVISLQPGLALGEEGEGRVLVATTGRVKVKVDATNGPIQIGDLLVTSDREGFAMKSLPVDVGGVRIHRPGTLIGKALQPLAQGTGEILVLLSMQ